MKKDTRATFTKLDVLILTVILVIALALRFYKITAPLADYHSWRQADTAAVARNFVRHGMHLLSPRYDDFSSVESGLENPEGYRFVEFPLYNGVVATFAHIGSFWPVEVWGRFTTALFSLILISIIYYLGLKESGRLTAITAAAIYACFPFFVFFSRVVLPETTALTLAFLSIFFLYKRSSLPSPFSTTYFILSLVFFSLSLLVKPTAGFYGLVLIYLMFAREKWRAIQNVQNYLFFFLATIPFLLWRYYIMAHPEGIPSSNWLITSVNTSQGLQNIFFKPAFFRWIFFERINNNILGGYLSSFFILGLIHKQRTYLIQVIFLSALVYLFTFQGGNVQHEYYQTLILPALCLVVGLGIDVIFRNTKLFLTPYITAPLVVSIMIFTAAISYYKVKDFYYYPPEFPKIAQVTSFLTKPTDKIVTDRSGDTTLLYVIDRKGSPALYKEMSKFKEDGYAYFLSTNKDKTEETKREKQYKLIFESDKFALFKL